MDMEFPRRIMWMYVCVMSYDVAKSKSIAFTRSKLFTHPVIIGVRP